MRKPRIFTLQPLEKGTSVELEAQQSSHIIRVLRLKITDKVQLFNGNGSEYLAEIIQADRKHVALSILEQVENRRESPLITHLGLVISKGDRFEYALQKATELGVNKITPLTSERCEVHLKGDRIQKKLDQWRAISISACEQCQRNTIPKIEPITSLANWVTCENSALRLVLHHRAPQPMASFKKPESLAFLVGPEGGLSETEIELAHQNGFLSSLMGPRVLRTETAPIVALSVAQHLWGDF